jgi:hypothetical protein
VHFEIPSDDIKRSKKFYNELPDRTLSDNFNQPCKKNKMRKVILSNTLRLMASMKDQTDWHVVDEEFNEYATLFFSKLKYNFTLATFRNC